jgi:CelD/BcsL family acetyltransferase involved in cellulose biosynthesis
MAKLHIKQWGGHSFGSGFSNKRFVDFHRNIMTQGIGQTAHVAKYTAGDQLLGYLYYFTFGTTVYFYLSAINYANHNNKYKPGLVMHKLAMEDFMHQGFSSYDFLAGKARYKTSLSNQEYLLYNVKIYSNKWYYAPIMVAVRVKRYLMAKALRK